jgi:hypothetical protein
MSSLNKYVLWGDHFGLSFVSKVKRPFGIVQAAVSGVILLRFYIFAV